MTYKELSDQLAAKMDDLVSKKDALDKAAADLSTAQHNLNAAVKDAQELKSQLLALMDKYVPTSPTGPIRA